MYCFFCFIDFTVRRGGAVAMGLDEVECGICKVGVTLIHTLIQQNSSRKEVVDKLTSFCTTFHIEKHRVCHGIVNNFEVLICFLFMIGVALL